MIIGYMQRLLLIVTLAAPFSCDSGTPRPLQVSVRHPEPGAVVGASEYVMGSVSVPHALLRINGRAVPVHRQGGFLAFLPTPKNGRFEILAHAGADTVRVSHPVRRAPRQEPSTPLDRVTAAAGLRGPERLFALAADSLQAPRSWTIFPGTKARILSRGLSGVAVVAAGRRLWLSESDIGIIDTLNAPPPAGSLLGDVRVLRFENHVEVLVAVPHMPPIRAEAHADSLVVTLAGTRTSPFPIPLTLRDPLVRSIRRRATDEGTQLAIVTTSPIFGYQVAARGDTLVVRLRRPARISLRSPLKDLTVVVDAGHPPGGAVGPTGVEEQAITAAVAEELAAQLKERGARVVLTRTGARSVSLAERLTVAATANGHAFVSIHVDAAPPGRDPFAARGTATYAFEGSAAPLAAIVQSRLISRLRLPDRGIRQGDFAVLRQTWMPAILCEGATLTIPEDEAALRTKAFREKYATGVREGLEKYFSALAEEQRNPKVVQEIVESLRTQYPEAVSVSPHGRFILLKDFAARRFGLLIARRADSSVITQTWSPNRQFGAAWRPDSRAVAFFVDSAGDQRYRLRILDLPRGIERETNAPSTRTPHLAWSPNGAHVAYIRDDFLSGQRRIVVAAVSGGQTEVLSLPIAQNAGFTWSPDGSTIATVRQGSENSLAILPLQSRLQVRAVVKYGEIREVLWPPRCACILSTTRKMGEEFFKLTKTSLRTGTTEVLAEEIGDIGTVLENDGMVWYHVTRDGETFFRAIPLSGQPAMHVARRTTGSGAVIGFDMLSKVVIANLVGRTAPPRLVEFPLRDNGFVDRGGYSALERKSAFVGPTRLEIRSHDGIMIPAFFWQRKDRQAHPRLLVLLHGGPALFVSRTWDAGVQHAVSKNMSVLAVNYRGSTGYGASFEAKGVELGRQVADVMAALVYARDTLGIDPADIVLWGHSYGALLAARTLAINPRAVGRAVLISLVGDPAFDIKVKRRVPIFAFHGRQDVAQSADSARAILGRVFDRRSIQFVTLDDEGHSFRRLESWARVYAAALR